MRKMTTMLLCTVMVALTISSCGQSPEKIERKQLKSFNTTSHIFHLPIDVLRDTIVRMFDFEAQISSPVLKKVFYYYTNEKDIGDTTYVSMVTFKPETALRHGSSAQHYFANSGAENDIYLHGDGFTWFSPLYHIKGMPLRYKTPFVLNLKSIDKEHTQVTVVAENPIVWNGTTGLGPHGPLQNEVKVHPTTIEEHTLLQFIAGNLGDRTLEPLKMPTH